MIRSKPHRHGMRSWAGRRTKLGKRDGEIRHNGQYCLYYNATLFFLLLRLLILHPSFFLPLIINTLEVGYWVFSIDSKKRGQAGGLCRPTGPVTNQNKRKHDLINWFRWRVVCLCVCGYKHTIDDQPDETNQTKMEEVEQQEKEKQQANLNEFLLSFLDKVTTIGSRLSITVADFWSRWSNQLFFLPPLGFSMMIFWPWYVPPFVLFIWRASVISFQFLHQNGATNFLSNSSNRSRQILKKTWSPEKNPYGVNSSTIYTLNRTNDQLMRVYTLCRSRPKQKRATLNIRASCTLDVSSLYTAVYTF